ncbi:MAG: hypothetical protein HC905_30990, partial [Bacteroidales bacterium]|nr:hypothetical protein [Bacteroidales bacterium]
DAENLKVTKYFDDREIPNVTDANAWAALSTPGYCWYDNDSSTYSETYGALYNWYTVATDSLCPAGWHVSTDDEWITLVDYLGGLTDAGGLLKETDTTHWASPNTGATNETGFTALPSGNRSINGKYDNINDYGYWWGFPEYSSSSAWYRRLNYDHSNIYRHYNHKNNGFSVRCLRD